MAKAIDQAESEFYKKLYLISSLVICLGILAYFKYYNFLSQNVNLLFSSFSIDLPLSYNNILLPVGISFFTFQSLSYTIDVYFKKVQVEKHLGIYALFVSFFPQLVAGPIERSGNLLAQFRRNVILSVDNFIVGMKYIIVGFFMKLVVADRVSLYVDSVYNNVDHHDGYTFIIATILFSFQIYCDFAGYSSIAIGTAKVLGYDLMLNFKRPYFSKNLKEFWSRWHISLSTWFRDYVYIPLGGNRVTNWFRFRNLLITFVVSGLWHGANWTFILWGLFHGLFLIIENIFNQITGNNESRSLKLLKILWTYILVCFIWIFFRSNNLLEAKQIIISIFSKSGSLFIDYETLFYSAIAIGILLIQDLYVEKIGDDKYFDSRINMKTVSHNAILVMLILYLGVFDGGQFIYFQF